MCTCDLLSIILRIRSVSSVCTYAAHANRVYRYPYSNVNFHLSRHSIFVPIVLAATAKAFDCTVDLM